MTDYTALSNEELSAEIAKRLFGWDGIPCPIPYCHHLDRAPYASDHNAAMGLVVLEMRRLGWHFCMDEKAGQSLISFWGWAGDTGTDVLVPYGQEPRAICEACLCALDATEPSQ